MKISVIIPTFNRADLLGRAIDSVLRQTLLPHEIIIVDDGSEDHTVSMLNRDYGDVKLIKQENQGVSSARNTGIECATADWVAFLDSDDEWLPEKLEKQVGALNLHIGLQICHTDEIWMRNGKRVNAMKKHAKPDGRIFQQCLPLCCVSPSSVLINRQLIMSEGLFDESLPACEDYDLWLRLFSRNETLLVNEFLLVKYGGHDDQLSQKYWGMDRFRVKALIKILQQGELQRQDYQAALSMLLRKLKILISGFSKRGNIDQKRKYQLLYEQWRPAC